jgi:hypothetical protein
VGQNASTARSAYDAWNDRDFDRFAELFKSGEIVMVGSGTTLTGSNGARQFAEMWAGGFPDGRVTIDNVIDGDGGVAIEYTGRGKQTGVLETPMGAIDPTGKSVELKLCDTWTFSSDGAPKQMKTYFDTGSLMTQLGVAAPQMAGAGISS